MSLVMDGGMHIHYPKEGGPFEFDDEVATIFESMATRSIPYYNEVHRVHSSIAVPFILHTVAESGCIRILDVGSSTGKFLDEVESQLCLVGRTSECIKATAMDISDPMLEQIKKKLPWVNTVNHDICIAKDPSWYRQFDIINLTYVLQFIDRDSRALAIRNIHDMLAPGGVLFYAGKEQIVSPFHKEFSNEYYRWRLANGYSVEEIHAKSQALKKSMWLDRQETTVTMLRNTGFTGVTETTRWLEFASLVAFKC